MHMINLLTKPPEEIDWLSKAQIMKFILRNADSSDEVFGN